MWISAAPVPCSSASLPAPLLARLLQHGRYVWLLLYCSFCQVLHLTAGLWICRVSAETEHSWQMGAWAMVSVWLQTLSHLCQGASKLSNPGLTIPNVSLWEEHGWVSFIVSIWNIACTKTFLWGWKFFAEPANYFHNLQSALTFLIATINPHSSTCPRSVQGNNAFYAQQHSPSFLICQKDYCTVDAECEELAA